MRRLGSVARGSQVVRLGFPSWCGNEVDGKGEDWATRGGESRDTHTTGTQRGVQTNSRAGRWWSRAVAG